MSWTEIMYLKNEFHIAAADMPVLKSFNININILGTTAKNVGTFKSSKNGSVRIKFKVQSMATGGAGPTTKYYAILSKNGEEVDRGTLFELTNDNREKVPQFIFADFNVQKNAEYEISIAASYNASYISFQNCSVCGVLMLEGVVE